MATIHAFNHNPTMASAAAACGGQGWRGPLSDVNCLACVEILDERRWALGCILDMEAAAHAENARRTPVQQAQTVHAGPSAPLPAEPLGDRWGFDRPARNRVTDPDTRTDADDDARYEEARQAAVDAAHGEAADMDAAGSAFVETHAPCAGSADCYCADAEPAPRVIGMPAWYGPAIAKAAASLAAGKTYGRPTPMPAPAGETTEARTPDAYGVAVGDLVAGTCVTRQCSAIGVVLAIVPRVSYAGMDGNRYRVRCGELYATGEIIERILHDHPSVIVPAGEPVRCATCGGEHESGERFVACLVAHLRAEREAAAVSA